MRFRLWGLLLALSLLAVHRPAHAVICDVVTPAEQVRRAAVVLTGKIEAIGEVVKLDEPMPVIPVTLTVERVHKGETAPSSTIYLVPVADAPKLRVGERWLLFLSRSPEGNLKAGPCTLSARVPAGMSVTPLFWPVLYPVRTAAGGLAALLGAVFAYRRYRVRRT